MASDTYKNRILVVDDNQPTIFLYKKILGEKFTLLTASGGKEALSILNEEDPPDIMLLDIMMPEISGYDLFDEIKKDIRIASIPIIFVTALGSETDELKGLETGAVDYITKPIEQNILIARINNILSLSQYQRESKEKLPEILNELFTDELVDEGEDSVEEFEETTRPKILSLNPYYEEGKADLLEQELGADYELAHFTKTIDLYQHCLQKGIPDLILFDNDHLVDNRFECIQKINGDPQTRSIPIILLTSIRNIEDETLAFESGCSDYVNKPIVTSILKARVRVHLELHKHRRLFEAQLES